MKIFIGADHNGYDMKAALIAALQKSGHEVIDEGDKNHDPADDFPQFASRVVTAMRAEGEAVGILICGSGQGMCIAANRYKGIRASLVWDEQEAHAARNDDDSNVLCLPARFINDVQAIAIAEKWLQTPFAGAARFKRRIAELDSLA
jgi:ribose 5-phosphate isomerase B